MKRKSTYLIAANCESLNKRQNFGSPNDNAKVFPSSDEWAPIASTVSGHTKIIVGSKLANNKFFISYLIKSNQSKNNIELLQFVSILILRNQC